jgi:hypothetical protein
MATVWKGLRRVVLAAARWPAVHFVVLGALSFAVHGAFAQRGNELSEEERTILVSAERVAALRAEYRRGIGAPPSPAELERLVGDVVEEELLFREGVRRGLHRNDPGVRERLVQAMAFTSPEGTDAESLYRQAIEVGLDRSDSVVRRIVVEKMRLLVRASVPADATEDELQECLARHRDLFRLPQLISFRHVFFGAEKRGAGRAMADAIDAASALARGGVEPAGLGDPFLLGSEFRGRAKPDVDKVFGPEFRAAVFDLAPGAWSGPIASAYGVHLVWVEEKVPERDPSLDEVRSRVARLYQDERRRDRLRDFVGALKGTYTVRVEADAGETGSKPAQG